ncbi:hypothetical protein SAY86_020399 [Trapa natans]|uniref:RRM domain-containing protein n=1 Tax=Trapa natans TaxID=22666 RepID=A0AAN7R5J0_TRANT|nr:hypothetical protein SAY86_020399 [Trapa natans]
MRDTNDRADQDRRDGAGRDMMGRNGAAVGPGERSDSVLALACGGLPVTGRAGRSGAGIQLAEEERKNLRRLITFYPSVLCPSCAVCIREKMSHFGRSGPPDISDTYSLLVLNIAFRTTADDLFPLFDKYGKVVDVFIPRDRRTGESRGFAFVRYKYADEAHKAVEKLDGRVVDGREITVQFAKYGPNAERIHRGRISETVSRPRHKSRSRSPLRRYRDDPREGYSRRSSRSRSRDRYERNRYREKGRDDTQQSRSPSASPDYSRGRDRDRNHNDRQSRSHSVDSGSPRRSRSPYRKHSLSGSPHEDRSPVRRSRDRQPSARSASPHGRSPDSRSPSPLNSNIDE